MRSQRKYTSFLKDFLAITLLGVYAFVTFSSGLHNYFHHEHHHQEVCSAEAEKNPCHKKIFHHNVAEGCKHATHVYALENPCELCDAILAKYYFPNEKAADEHKSEITQVASFFERQQFFRLSITSIRLRGPPSSLPSA